MRKGLKDRFSQKAKQDHFLARSVYKLEEIDRKYKLFNKKQKGTLIEFGISPGSWYQFYQKKIHPDVFVVGIDLKPFKSKIINGTWLEADILQLTAEQLRSECKNEVFCVLSDALPNITGNKIRDQANIENLRDHITDLAFTLLRPGGMMVIKTFDCPSHMAWVKRCRARFDVWGREKPAASRKESPELYCVGKGFKGV